MGVTCVPAAITVSPIATSEPAKRNALPAGTLLWIRTESLPTRSVSSTITTASQPSGNGAPVIMRMAVPGATAMLGAAPAANSPTTCNSTGTVCRSLERTAYPSTAVLANGGTFSPDTTSLASTRPAATWRVACTGAPTAHAASTIVRTSCSGVMQETVSAR